jgi:hypothetical protein
VRNSSLVEYFCAYNVTGLKLVTEATGQLLNHGYQFFCLNGEIGGHDLVAAGRGAFRVLMKGIW